MTTFGGHRNGINLSAKASTLIDFLSMPHQDRMGCRSTGRIDRSRMGDKGGSHFIVNRLKSTDGGRSNAESMKKPTNIYDAKVSYAQNECVLYTTSTFAISIIG
jgi:hypothetical protein